MNRRDLIAQRVRELREVRIAEEHAAKIPARGGRKRQAIEPKCHGCGEVFIGEVLGATATRDAMRVFGWAVVYLSPERRAETGGAWRYSCPSCRQRARQPTTKRGGREPHRFVPTCHRCGTKPEDRDIAGARGVLAVNKAVRRAGWSAAYSRSRVGEPCRYTCPTCKPVLWRESYANRQARKPDGRER